MKKIIALLIPLLLVPCAGQTADKTPKVHDASVKVLAATAEYQFPITARKQERHPMQAFTIYNDIVFVCFDAGYCETYDLKTGNRIGDFKLGCFIPTNHCGNVNFGKQFPPDNKEFPAMYVSGDLTTRACYVENVTPTGSKLIQTIHFDLDNDYGGSQVIIDHERDRIVYLQRKLKKIRNPENTFMIYEFRLPKLSEGNVRFTDNDVIEKYELPLYAPLYQGAIIVNGRILQSHGNQKDPYGVVVGILAFDIKKRSLEARVDLTESIRHEPQSVCFYKGKFYMNYNSRGFYEILGAEGLLGDPGKKQN